MKPLKSQNLKNCIDFAVNLSFSILLMSLDDQRVYIDTVQLTTTCGLPVGRCFPKGHQSQQVTIGYLEFRSQGFSNGAASTKRLHTNHLQTVRVAESEDAFSKFTIPNSKHWLEG